MPKILLDKNGNKVEVSGHVKDLTGKRFGKLSVIGFDFIDKHNVVHWFCKCDCGNTKSVVSSNLTSGTCKSCGCYQKEMSQKSCKRLHTKHGLAYKHKLYSVWKNMRERCNNSNSKSYKNYGARGIKVSNEWDEFLPFYEWALSNGYKEGLSIERIDNEKGYSPANCKFVTNTEQQRNRRKTVKLSYNGKTLPLSEWCEIYGLNMKTCYGRLHDYGWTNPREILFGKGGA